MASMQPLKSLNSRMETKRILYRALKTISFLSRNKSEGREEEEGERWALWPNGKVHTSLWICIPVHQEMKAQPRQKQHNKTYLGKTWSGNQQNQKTTLRAKEIKYSILFISILKAGSLQKHLSPHGWSKVWDRKVLWSSQIISWSLSYCRMW